MTITYDHGDIIWQCDGLGCHETIETNTSNFDSARNLLTRHQWKSFKTAGDDEWKHLCKACRQGGSLELRPSIPTIE